MTLSDRIEHKAARVAVVGQGHVGLPLTVELARAGFHFTDLETDPERVDARNASRGIPDAAGRIIRL